MIPEIQNRRLTKRESIVQHLFEKFINHDVILFDDRFIALAEVVFKRVHDPVQKLDYK